MKLKLLVVPFAALAFAGCGGGNDSSDESADYAPAPHVYTNADGQPPKCVASGYGNRQWCNTDEEIVALSHAVVSGEATTGDVMQTLVGECVGGGESQAVCVRGAATIVQLILYNQAYGVPQ